MYKRRLKGYAAIGYSLMVSDPSKCLLTGKNVIFTGKDFQTEYLTDLSQARQSVIIASPKLWLSKRSQILEMLKELITRGVEVAVFVKHPSDKDALLLSISIGARIIVKEGLSMHTTIINKSLVWYGSVNYLGYNTGDDNAIKLIDSSMAEEMIGLLYD
ncbi:hypothetical protein SAMN05216357_10625 [Porphyromonadaceae bacterium KH3CP3RA]|nr:hypothetical protein SAMN05216357_10625 [Porphyromonadaceae bacterium KH3CP3RA]